MSSSAECGSVFSLPIAALEYRDMAGHLVPDSEARPGNLANIAGGRRRAETDPAEGEMTERIARERAEATHQAEQRLRQEYESKLQAERAPIAAALAAFEVKRGEYFARVEAEVVQLSLAIAAKILHREAQVDPMLVAALVRMTIEKMHEGSSVTVRVGAGRSKRWKEYFAGQPSVAHVEVTEDAELSDHDCVLETELRVCQLRVGHAVEGSRTGLLRSAGAEAGQSMNRPLLTPYTHYLETGSTLRWMGRINQVVGNLIESDGPFCSVGESSEIVGAGGRSYAGEIIGFRGFTMLSMAADHPQGIRFGDQIETWGARPSARVHRIAGAGHRSHRAMRWMEKGRTVPLTR